MEKFDRIVREALVMGGQARIRDTEITVNEIVRLSLDGKSQAEILEQFPALHAEDVHQAMGYAIDTSDIVQRIWQYWIRDNLNLQMELEILFEYPDLRENTDELERAIKVGISAMRLAQVELDYTNRISKMFTTNPNYSQADCVLINLESFFSRELFYPDQQIYISAPAFHKIKISKPNNLPNIIFPTEHELDYIISILAQREIKNLIDGESKPEISISRNGKTVSIIITRQIKLSDTGQSLYQEAIFNVASSISIVSYILHQAGSELKVTQDSDKVIFEFELPIFDDKV